MNKKSFVIPPTNKELKEKYENSRIKTKEDKICIFCNSKFKYGYSFSNTCGLCKLKFYCLNCNKEVIKELKLDKIYSHIRKELVYLADSNKLEEYKAFCSKKCISERNQKPGNCTICGKHSNKRTIAGCCAECRQKINISNAKKNSAAGVCKKCKENVEYRNALGYCSKCQSGVATKVASNNVKPGNCTICNKYSNKRTIAGLCSKCSKDKIEKVRLPGDCRKCNKYFKNRSYFGLCVECSKEIAVIKSKENMKPGVCLYCNKHSNKRNAVGICFKCNREISTKVARNNMAAGTCNKCYKLESNRDLFGFCFNCSNIKNLFFTKEDIAKLEKDLVNKKGFKTYKEFISKTAEIYNIKDIVNYIKEKLNIEGFIQPSHRINNKENATGRFIAEQELVDKGVKWFVFCSFATNGNIAVVGKSGSKLVNISGSDAFYFYKNSVTKNKLKEYNLSICHDFVLIWNNPSWTEKEALEYEVIIGDLLLEKFGIINSVGHKI